MILLGMTGPIGHGKTTFADAIVAVEPSTRQFETFQVVAEVADALHNTLQTIPNPDDIDAINAWLSTLPDILKKILRVQCTFQQIKLDPTAVIQQPVQYQKLFLHLKNLQAHPSLTRQKITQKNKEKHRPLLQWIGGYLVAKIDHGIWWNEVIRRAQDAAGHGAKVCVASAIRYPAEAEIVRKAGGKVIKIYRPNLGENDALDPTERERSSIQPDCTIINNGTLGDLSQLAAIFLRDAEAGTLQKEYRAKPV